MRYPIKLGPDGATVRTVANVIISGNRIFSKIVSATLSAGTYNLACVYVNKDTADKRASNILITGNFLEKDTGDSTTIGSATINLWYIHLSNSERVLLDGNFAFDGADTLAPVNSGRRGEVVVAVTPGPGNYTLNNT